MTGPNRPDPTSSDPRPGRGRPDGGRHSAGPPPVPPAAAGDPRRTAPPPDPRRAEPPAGPAPTAPPAPQPGASRSFPAWVAPVALVLAAIGTLLSLWAMKTASDNAPVALSGESKVRVCSAFATVSKAVKLQTNGGPEPLPEPLAATNSRQALLAGGEYLRQQIDGKTPGDLAAAAMAFADEIQILGLNYLGGAVSTEPAQADLIKRADASMNKVADLCK